MMNAGKSILYDPGGHYGDNLSNVTTPDVTSTVQQLRSITEVWIVLPIALLGIIGNVVSFFVLCHHRRHKLQSVTTLLQVWVLLYSSALISTVYMV